ncbi:MAG: hypothetical protein ACRDRS_11505 [Pseudonocardiaceae bacterium]
MSRGVAVAERVRAGSVRVLVVAVLVGLIGMHGLASGELGGCHGGMSPVSLTVAAQATAPAPMVMEVSAHTGGAAIAGVMARPEGHSAVGVMTGSVCQSVPPRGWPGVASLLALTVIGWLLGWDPSWPGWIWREVTSRAPPCSGVARLRWVCVSRT